MIWTESNIIFAVIGRLASCPHSLSGFVPTLSPNVITTTNEIQRLVAWRYLSRSMMKNLRRTHAVTSRCNSADLCDEFAELLDLYAEDGENFIQIENLRMQLLIWAWLNNTSHRYTSRGWSYLIPCKWWRGCSLESPGVCWIVPIWTNERNYGIER